MNENDKNQNDEIFLKLLKSKKLSELASKKIECLNESDIKLIEEIIQKEKDANSINTKDIKKLKKNIKKKMDYCMFIRIFVEIQKLNVIKRQIKIILMEKLYLTFP